MQKNEIIVFLFINMIFLSCAEKVNHLSHINEKNYSFINRPIASLDIPVQTFNIDAINGGKVIASSGSYIKFPPNSFVDKNGDLIKGNVKVNFREFQDPIDLFISGITMQYDTLGSNFAFESSAMCEINATQGSVEVFVNPLSTPSIHLITNNEDTKHNLYFLDTVQQKWVPIGKSKIDKVNIQQLKPKVKKASVKVDLSENVTEIPEPIKANPKRPIISVTIPYVDFVPELAIFKNTKFEIDPSETNYNPKDGDIEWDKVKLEKTDSDNLYKIIFTLGSRIVSYKVKPVYEGKDYEVALETYLDKMIEIEEKKLQNQSWSLPDTLASEYNSVSVKTYRMFNLLKFGIYNCDFILQGKFKEINAIFVDQNHLPLNFKSVDILNLDRNAKIGYNPQNLRISIGQRQALVAVNKDTLYYLTPDDFLNTKIDLSATEATFKMKRYIGEIESPSILRNLLEI